MNREGVASERRIGAEECLGVGIVCGPDITPLGVHDDEQPGAARFGYQALEGAEATPPLPFVKSRLELDQTDGPGCGFECYVGEAIQSVGRVPDAPGIEDLPGGVEPPREGSELRAHSGESRGERVGHIAILLDPSVPLA